MSSYEEMLKNICRVCLCYYKAENMVPLIESTNCLTHYGKAVITFANISIEFDDNLPTKMCSNCLSSLKQTIMFKRKCESSDRQLKNLINCVNIGPENLDEKIVQYTMFQLYFPTETAKNFNQRKSNKQHFKNICGLTDNLDSLQNLTTKTTSDTHLDFIKNNDTDEASTKSVNNKNNICDQSIPSQNKQSNCIQDDEKLLDILESMVGFHSEMVNDNLMHNKKRSLLRRQKLRRNRQAILETRRYNKNMLRNLTCKVCRKVLANQHTYEHHMQRHNGCRYICEHCGKGFPVNAELNIHRVARHGTGSFLQCQHCSFKAPRKFDLTEHERLHTGERPYTCDKCGLTFRRRGIWRKHLIYHMEKKIQCTQCPRKFYQRSEMLAHANNVHDRLYVYLCSKCGATYAKPSTVRRHLTERHGIPREMQGKVIRVNKGSANHKQTM